MIAKPLRVLLVDDERPARKWLRELLAVHADVQIIGEANNVPTAVKIANKEQPDAILLDVQMPPDTGFDLLPQLTFTPRIVFVTAYDTFAVRAYEANALDYLLKPVHPKRLAETLRRLQAPMQPPADPPRLPGHLQLDDIVPLRDGGLLRMATVRDIAAIEAEAPYSRIWLCRQDRILILRRIKEWEDILPRPPFLRIDRSLLVNLSRIAKVAVRDRNETQVFFTGLADPLSIGRPASLRLRKALLETPASPSVLSQ